MATLDSIEAQLEALEIKIEAERFISRVCTTCGGVGYLLIITNEEESQIDCPLCGGETKIDWGFQEAL